MTGKLPATAKVQKLIKKMILMGFLRVLDLEFLLKTCYKRLSKMVSSNHLNPLPPIKFMRSLEKGFVMNIMIRNIVTNDIHSSSYIKKGKMN